MNSNSWTIRPNDSRMDYQQFDEPITQYNDHKYNGHHGIPLRDRLTDAFAYFPAEQYEYTGYVDRDEINNDGDIETDLDDTTKRSKKLARNILNQIQQARMSPAESQFIYSELLDSQALIVINRFRKDITQPWTVMKNRHINFIEERHGCKLVEVKKKLSRTDQKIKSRIERRMQKMYDLERGYNSAICNLRTAHPLTDYTDYLKRIKEHRIEIPDRFDISSAEPYIMGSSYLPMKMMSRYYRRNKRNIPTDASSLIDLTAITLFDLHSVRSKTMFCLHICSPNRRDGITVIDQASYTLNVVIHSPHLSQYLIYYGTTTNYSAYMLFDSTEATIFHLTYALLEPDLKRMVFYSPQHVLNAIELLATRTDMIKELVLKASNISESELLDFTHDESDNSDDSNDSNKTSRTGKSHGSNMTKQETLERIAHVFDVLYCIKKGYRGNQNIISECFTDLWPKLCMIGCEIRGQDRLILRTLKKTLSAKHKGITIYSPIYAIPEAVIGYNIECRDDNQYIMDPAQGYFEFLEINDTYFRNEKRELKPRGLRHIKKDRLYEIIVSSDHTDTLRQMTGEIVRICGHSESVPIVTPICREIEMIYSYAYDSDGEIKSKIITPYDIDQIFIDSDLDVLNYTYRKVRTTYKFYLELHRFDYDEGDSDRSENKSDEENSNIRRHYVINKEVKDNRSHYRLSRLLLHNYDSDDTLVDPNITEVEVRVVEPNTFQKIIKMRHLNSVDSNTIRMSRRIVDDYEIEILKTSIVHQF